MLAEEAGEIEQRLNYRAAMVVAAIYNVNRDPKKRKKPYTPEEILGIKKQRTGDMKAQAEAITGYLGGKVS